MKYSITISSGAGPVEVREFAALLTERILELCRRRKLEVIEQLTQGPKAKPSSVSLKVKGNAAKALADEVGTHALIHKSQKRGRRSRKRWFAGITIRPAGDEPENGHAEQIDPSQLKVETFRSAGPGGQHVNKTNSAVRMRHIPSGVSVRVDNARSQQANRRAALEQIAQKLKKQKDSSLNNEKSDFRSLHYQIIRGCPVRTYNIAKNGKLEVIDEN